MTFDFEIQLDREGNKSLFLIFIFFRHNVTFKTAVGESNSVQPEMVASWFETALRTLLSNYKLEDIFNADEFGLFYQWLPNKTLHLKSEKCSGGKNSKIRVTGLAAANSVGDKLPMFVIGKLKPPRCFKNVTSLPCRYRSQKKSWMDSTLFEEWVCELDVKFQKENRKIALIIDNCPAHPTIADLSNVKLIFLPPNTTSVSQPMDQGVIKCLKAFYRRRLVNLMIKRLEQGQDLPKISILCALQLLIAAWNNVTKSTIVICFGKAKISAKDQVNAAEDSDDLFKELENDLTELRKIDPTLVPQDLTAQEIVDVDINFITTDNPESDEEILESVRSDKDEETNGDDSLEIMEVFDEPIDRPTQTEIGNALETLQTLCLFNKSGDDIRLLLQRFESLVLKDELAVRKQSSIFKFFEKK